MVIAVKSLYFRLSLYSFIQHSPITTNKLSRPKRKAQKLMEQTQITSDRGESRGTQARHMVVKNVRLGLAAKTLLRP